MSAELKIDAEEAQRLLAAAQRADADPSALEKMDDESIAKMLVIRESVCMAKSKQTAQALQQQAKVQYADAWGSHGVADVIAQ